MLFSKHSLWCQPTRKIVYLLNQKVILFTNSAANTVYIGRSYRRLEDRISEHIPSSIRKSHAQNTDPSKFNSTEEAIQSIISHYRLRSRPKEVVQPINQIIPSSSKSAIWLHLMENPACAASYVESCFQVLAAGRNKFHVDVLEGVYINAEKPILCRQKEFFYITALLS